MKNIKLKIMTHTWKLHTVGEGSNLHKEKKIPGFQTGKQRNDPLAM